MERYTELEYQRRHLVEQTTPEGRAMVLSGIDRILDSLIDRPIVAPGVIETHMPVSAEGQAHLERNIERGSQ